MTNEELIERLARAATRELPDPGALLERAFEADAQPAARVAPLPLALAASLALVAATSAPLWLEPAAIDRERTATFVAAASRTAQLCVRNWNQALRAADRNPSDD